MALSLSRNNKPIQVVAYIDPCVNCEREVYDKYLETLDEGLLNLEGSPTRFCLKRTLDAEELMEVKRVQTEVQGKDVKFNLGYILVEMKYALIDILNPGEGISYKKDQKKGGADNDLIGVLDEAGVLTDLFTARQNLKGGKGKADPKKS